MKILKVVAAVLAIVIYLGGFGYLMTTDLSVKFAQEEMMK